MTSITPTTTTTTPLESQKMNQDVFSQLYQSLTPVMGTPAQESSSMFEEWLKQDFLSEYSANSSPEIATPLDQFLMSPPFHGKDEMKQSSVFDNSMVDLDVSAILDSPAPQLFTMPAAAAAATPVTPAAQMTSLFADIGDSLPAALAALAAVAAPSTPVVSTIPEKSPAVTSASTPTFSASPSRTRKHSDDIDPKDDAAVKRQKNTDAARRSRLRKVQKMETLEVRVSELEKINAGLLMRVAVLDSEKTNLKAKESSYENRIKVLEEQLAEAHKALSSRA